MSYDPWTLIKIKLPENDIIDDLEAGLREIMGIVGGVILSMKLISIKKLCMN